MSYRPVIQVPTDQKSVTIRIKKAWRDQTILTTISEALRDRFPVFHSPGVFWAKGSFKIEATGKIELLSVSEGGSKVEVSPIIGHPDVPGEVRRALIFLGMLMSFAAWRQTTTAKERGIVVDFPDVFANPKLAAWVEENMRLDSGSEFLGLFMSRFFEWLAKSDLL